MAQHSQNKEKGIKKMKQGMSYSCKEKTIILNVFKYFKQEYPEICVTEVVRRTAKATGCSEKSVFQFRKEEASVEGFKEPSKTKIRKNININSRDIKYDNSVRQSIKEIIYDLKYRGVVPSLNTIRKRINENESLPKFSLMTLRRLLFDMGFCYEKNGNKSILVEKESVGAKNNELKKVKSDQRKINLNQSENKINRDKPQMQVIQNRVNNVMNSSQNDFVHNENLENRFPLYFRQSENNVNHVSIQNHQHNVPLMVNHRNEIISHTGNVMSNLNHVPGKCDWINPPPPHNN
nr:uncharacterized protein LOC111423711 [Onthophagus taurus]